MDVLRIGTAILLQLVVVVVVDGTFEEYRLMNHLFSDYSNVVRPVNYSKDATVVKLGAALQQIVEMDQKNQIITLSLWMRLQWHDDHFHWNAEEYGNTTVLIVPSPHIWRPDIVLYSNADPGFNGMMDTSATITNEGLVYWNSPVIYKSTCKIDITYFPFDEQHCRLKFGSWAYNGYQIDIKNRSLAGETASYIDNGEWELVAMPVTNNVVYYSCCPEPFPDVTFTVIIKRRPLFYLFNLLLPCIIISMITVLDFYLPADAGEKVTLGITVLLALTVFLLIVADAMPPTSEVVPILSQYFIATIVLVSLSVLFTVNVLSLHYRLPGTKPVPKWMRELVFVYLARILCLSSVTNYYLKDKEKMEQGRQRTYEEVPGTHDTIQSKRTANGLIVYPIYNERFDEKIKSIAKNLEFLSQRAKDSDAEDDILTEWKHIAFVFDRLFMCIFLLATLIVTPVTLFQSKPYTDIEAL